MKNIHEDSIRGTGLLAMADLAKLLRYFIGDWLMI